MSGKGTVSSKLQNFIQQRYEDTSLVIYREQHSNPLSDLRIVEIAQQQQSLPKGDGIRDEPRRQSKPNQIVPGSEFPSDRGRGKRLYNVKRFAESEDDIHQGNKAVGESTTTTQSQICVML